MSIEEFLKNAAHTLTRGGILTARLDAQVLAAYVLGVDRSWLLAHGDHALTAPQHQRLEDLIAKRLQHFPVAYLTGQQEFYGRVFDVTPDVLIPRPETEACIDLIKKNMPAGRLLDVGTGSGAIAVTTALELPALAVEACDINPQALAVAAQNAAKFEASVTFFESNLLAFAKGPYNAIVANLPYVDTTWQRSPETAAEPSLALFAGDGGLALIKKLLKTAPAKLTQNGYLILEADPRQHTQILHSANHFNHVVTEGFVVALQLKPDYRQNL